jgi:hypothetical protein
MAFLNDGARGPASTKVGVKEFGKIINFLLKSILPL